MEYKKPLTWPGEGSYATRPGAGVASLEQTKQERTSNIQANLGGCIGGSRECGATWHSPFGVLGVMHLENNEAPANDRGCVADASHVS